MWTGGSAGSRGAMAHVEHVEAMVESAQGKRLPKFSVALFLDSPLWLNIHPCDDCRKKYQGDLEFTRSFYEYFVRNETKTEAMRKNIMGEECLEEHGTGEPWKCLFPEVRLPFIAKKMPLMIVHML